MRRRGCRGRGPPRRRPAAAPRSSSPCASTRHRRLVRGAEGRPGQHGVDAGPLRLEHEGVEVALQGGERAAHREGPGHVGGVERGRLGPHVEQHQLARGDRTAVLDPVQRRGVPAAAHDRVVTEVVAHRPGPTEEGALEPALAVLEHVVPLAHGVLEPERGDVAGRLELAELPLVLDQPGLGQHPGELPVPPVVDGDQRVDPGVGASEDPGLRRAREAWGQVVEVAGLDAEGGGDLLQRGSALRPTARRTGGRGRTRRSRVNCAAWRRAPPRRPR